MKRGEMVPPETRASMMKMEVDAFNRFVATMLRRFRSKDMNDALRGIVIDLLKRIHRGSPVDTGRSRAGWSKFLVDHGVFLEQGPRMDCVYEGTMKSAWSEDLGSKTRKFITVVNGVKYVVYLEFGWSRQAPRGMVRVSMQEMAREAPKQLKRAIIDLFCYTKKQQPYGGGLPPEVKARMAGARK